MNSTRVLLVGAAGRMGQAISALAETAGVEIAEKVEIGESIADRISNCDVVVDFSQPEGTAQARDACIAAGKPLVVGTTGHSADQLARLADAAKSIALLIAPNFSIGVNVLFWLTRNAAKLLGPDFDLEVVEAHHRLKKDAPSGTAKRLAEILANVRELSYGEDVAHGRHGAVGERPRDEIGVHAIRGGDIVGDHTVIFAGRGERLELTHRAASRETFAAGALQAARWIVGKPPGRYGMQDVLGLSSPGE